MKTFNCRVTFNSEDSLTNQFIEKVTNLTYLDRNGVHTVSIEDFINDNLYVKHFVSVQSESKRLDIIHMSKLISIQFD